MQMRRTVFTASLLTAALGLGFATPTLAQTTTTTTTQTTTTRNADVALERIGSLKCEISSPQSVEAQTTATCEFRRMGATGEPFGYNVTFSNLAIGPSTRRGQLLFSVLAPTREIDGGALQGDYSAVDELATRNAFKAEFALLGGKSENFALELLAPAGQAVEAGTTAQFSVKPAS
ncbi:MAG: DUF992 domain-containing protein [Pseudomonadota bacterium]